MERNTGCLACLQNGTTPFAWSEITQISAGKLDYITRVETTLELDHESGHYLEANAAWAGFDRLVAEIGRRYSLPIDWYAAVERLGARDHAMVIWQRDDGPGR